MVSDDALSGTIWCCSRALPPCRRHVWGSKPWSSAERRGQLSSVSQSHRWKKQRLHKRHKTQQFTQAVITRALDAAVLEWKLKNEGCTATEDNPPALTCRFSFLEHRRFSERLYSNATGAAPLAYGRNVKIYACVHKVINKHTRRCEALQKGPERQPRPKPFTDAGCACTADSGFHLCTSVSPPNTANQRSCSQHRTERTLQKVWTNNRDHRDLTHLQTI